MRRLNPKSAFLNRRKKSNQDHFVDSVSLLFSFHYSYWVGHYVFGVLAVKCGLPFPSALFNLYLIRDSPNMTAIPFRDATFERKSTTWLICAFLVLAIVAVYWPVVNFSYILLDDPDYVFQNPPVLNGLSWQGTIWAFTHFYVGNWHPLTWLSHMLDVQLFGLDAGAHHATGVLFHAVNTVLLFLWLRRITGFVWRSALVAGLFGLHPLHVESVAWIAERKDVLSTFLLPAHLDSLQPLCAKIRSRKSEVRNQSPISQLLSSVSFLLVRAGFLCAGFDEQADACNITVCVAAAGLLAAGENFNFQLSTFNF